MTGSEEKFLFGFFSLKDTLVEQKKIREIISVQLLAEKISDFF